MYALCEEGDRSALDIMGDMSVFLSTPSVRRATGKACAEVSKYAAFLSTPSARRATLLQADLASYLEISIHALREEGDAPEKALDIWYTDISIHALREEGDRSVCGLPLLSEDFYPRPPRGGRLSDTEDTVGDVLISIHALREEGDQDWYSRSCMMANFYPRPPRGGRRYAANWGDRFSLFLSTPSARRATYGKLFFLGFPDNFYPRPPRGGRHFGGRFAGVVGQFLSTPSARRAT